MTVLLAVKLKNSLPADCVASLKNIIINGDKRGCSGFVQQGDSFVYINTDGGSLGYLARTAANNKDYQGGRNCFARTPGQLVALVAALLKQAHYQV